MKTEGLDARDLRPCDKCHGSLSPIARRLSVVTYVVKPQAVNAFMGTAAIVGGHLAIAHALAPDTELFESTNVLGGLDLLLCQTCYSVALAEARLDENVEPVAEITR